MWQNAPSWSSHSHPEDHSSLFKGTSWEISEITGRYSNIMDCAGYPIRFEYQDFFALSSHGFESVGWELLVRPTNWMRVNDFLETLKQQWKTFDLFCCVLSTLWTLDSKDHLVSVNAYPCDVRSSNFQFSVWNATPIGTAIEFLEDDSISEDDPTLRDIMLIQNARWLKENGFKIAIDDFPAGSSRDILLLLETHDISVDIIKIDGECAQRFYQKTPSQRDEDFASEIAWDLQRIARKYPIICIVEWIQDVEHLHRLNPSGNTDITFYVQGKNIKAL